MRFIFDSVLAISPAERRRVVLAFCYAFSTAGAYVVGRSAADALFLARVGSAWLPLMYFLSACTVGLAAVIFLQFATGRSLKQVILLTLLLLSTISLVLCQLVQGFDHAMVLLVGIYLLAEVRGCLNTIQYGILVNELFAGSRNQQHAAGLLGAAATLAGIVFGAVVGFETYQLGTVHLLYVVAGLEFIAMVPIVLLRRLPASRDGDDLATEAHSTTMPIEAFAPVEFGRGLFIAARSPYVRGIALLVGITVMVGTLIEFQWKTSVAASFADQEDQMTSFFGLFHAAVNLLTGTIQIVLTGKFLRHVGTRNALLVFPAALLAGTLGVAFASFGRVALWAITLAKGCDVFKRSINDPAILILYAPLNHRLRRRAITFVAGIVKPFAEAIAALLIIAIAGIVGGQAITYLALLLVCAWMAVAWRYRANRTSPDREHRKRGLK